MDGRFDLVIVGAGIIGLATARETLRRSPRARLLVIEKEPEIARHQTGHNSGVVHSGIYYRSGSLKATTCVEGAAEMLAFCRQEGIPCEPCGKVVVAADRAEVPALDELHRGGVANGVPGLSLIGPERLREIEPAARGVRALHVPGTAVTDYRRVALRLAERAGAAGARILTAARVTGFARSSPDIVVETTAGAYATRHVINCAGLHADRVAALAGARPGVRIVPFRGEYHEIAAERRHLVRALIYPVPRPELPFLGVHLSRTINGEVEAGPNALWALAREGYRRSDANLRDIIGTLSYPGFWMLASKHWRYGVGELYRSKSRRAFLRALQRLVPDLRAEDLRLGGSGVRAQAVDRTGALVDDFTFEASERMIHVLNVPSPAATASLAIARRIVDMLGLPARGERE
ncbi:MAG TPA: L-2-hydroxyglutarate oxidase [Candidatus Polarisedimenticolia bacterium]|jgi:L-2-hydroxyglutarate oxidase LhgO